MMFSVLSLLHQQGHWLSSECWSWHPVPCGKRWALLGASLGSAHRQHFSHKNNYWCGPILVLFILVLLISIMGVPAGCSDWVPWRMSLLSLAIMMAPIGFKSIFIIELGSKHVQITAAIILAALMFTDRIFLPYSCFVFWWTWALNGGPSWRGNLFFLLRLW